MQAAAEPPKKKKKTATIRVRIRVRIGSGLVAAEPPKKKTVTFLTVSLIPPTLTLTLIHQP